MTTVPRYRTVILDVDSTLTTLEGIDWLARRRGATVAAAVAELTDRAMRGDIALDAVYGERLAAVRPTRADVAALAEAYIAHTVADAAETVATLRAAGVAIAVVSGGLREAVVPFAATLGVPSDACFAVGIHFDARGDYVGYDAESPLARQTGKPTVAAALLADGQRFPRPALAVGDGATDAAMRGTVDAFAAFTGVARRAPVIAAADHVVDAFAALRALVLSSDSPSAP